MYLQTSDLYTVIYQSIIDEISQGDATIPTRAISAAIAEASGYLSHYDLVALFGTDSTDPTYPDDWLLCLVKDLAAWYIIKLANPNIDYTHIRTCYNDAIDTLAKIQKGDITPQSWPLYVPPTSRDEPGTPVAWNSGPRRHNHF